jgi:hypothetical protein
VPVRAKAVIQSDGSCVSGESFAIEESRVMSEPATIGALIGAGIASKEVITRLLGLAILGREIL